MKKIIVLMLFFVINTTGCQKAKTPQIQEQPAVLVKVMNVEKGNIREVLSCVGDIKAQEEIIVYSKVSGKLIENTVSEGDIVKKNEVLALIDRDEVGFKFEKAPVVSPIDGIVGRIYLDKGTHIRASSDMSSGTPVALVVDMDKMYVKINVIEKDIPKVKKGQKAEIMVDAYPDEIFTGEVDRISPVVDLASRTALAEIKLSNTDHRLKSGMFARVKVITSVHENALIVPIEAIVYQEGNANLFVVEQNIARLREVKIGFKDAGGVEIASGLKEGEKVIIEGAYGLKNNTRVKVKAELH